MSVYNIQGVEIFSAGTWNGDKYTVDDLNEMVEAFSETKAGVQPFIKIGHDREQKLIANEKGFPQRDGKPAAGWIDRIYVRGNKLVADFSEVPQKIYDLLQKKAYKKVSSEIFWNIKINNKIYKKMLGAVALLGADTPGVMNLSDILAMYGIEIGEGELKVYNKEITLEQEGDLSMDLEVLKKEYADKVAAQTAEIQKLKESTDAAKAEAEAQKKEVEALKEFKTQAEKRQLELEVEAQKAKTDKFLSDLEKDLNVSPAMKPYIVELLGETKKEYSVGDKKCSKEDLIKEMLTLHSSALKVNLEESSSKGYSKGNNAEDAGHKEAEEIAKKEGISYSEAAKKVLNKKK